MLCILPAPFQTHLLCGHTAKGLNADERSVLSQWVAGKKVSMAAAEAFGMDNCFAVDTISDKVFARMRGKSYKDGCGVKRSDLRYVRTLHRNAQGEILLGEIVCNKAVSDDLVSIFRQLFEARYPIERMVLVDEYGADDNASMAANNTSCFNFRRIQGSKKMSCHSYGCAVDINTFYNPYVKRRKDGSLSVRPAAAKKYADRSKSFDYKIEKGDLCYWLFIRHGFTWGGNWKSAKDYQHFEKPLR